MADMEERTSDARRKVTCAESANNDYDGQIERLYDVMRRIDDMEGERNAIMDYYSDGYEAYTGSWSGERFNVLKDTVDNQMCRHISDYYGEIDDVMRQLNQKVRDLKRLKSQNNNLIRSLMSWIDEWS